MAVGYANAPDLLEGGLRYVEGVGYTLQRSVGSRLFEVTVAEVTLTALPGPTVYALDPLTMKARDPSTILAADPSTIHVRGVTSMFEYVKGVTLGPAITVEWRKGAGTSAGTLYDFSTGHTFSAQVMADGTRATLLETKSAGITGSSGTLGYNVLIDWETADHDTLTATPGGATYVVYLYATPSGGDPMKCPVDIKFLLKSPPA